MATQQQTATLVHVLTKYGNPADKDFHLDPNDMDLEVGENKTKYKIRGATIEEILTYLETCKGSKERVKYFKDFKENHCAGTGGGKAVKIGDSPLLKLSSNNAISVSCGPYTVGKTFQLAKATYHKDHIRIEVLSAEESEAEKASGNWKEKQTKKKKAESDEG